jgi:hypothetical protein
MIILQILITLTMEKEIDNYKKNGYIVFSMGIGQKKDKNVWKKNYTFLTRKIGEASQHHI